MADFETLMDRAKRAIQQESLPRAQELLEEAALIAPGNRDVHSMLGVVYAKVGEPDLSVAEFRRVLKTDPDHLTTLRNLARVLEQQERIDEAIALIEHALALDPEDATTNRVHKRLCGKAEGTDIPAIGEHADGLLGLCPICENPIPTDTDRRTCDLCGVSWVPLISGRVRIEETLRANEDQLVCAHCGSVIENYKAMHCLRCGTDFLTGETPGGGISSVPEDVPQTSAAGSEHGGLIVAGGVLCFLMALMLWGLSSLQSLIAATGIQSELGFWALLNGVVGAAYVVFGIGVLQRSKWGYDWAFGSSVLNVVLMGVQVLIGAWLLTPAALVALTIALLLHPARESFT